MINREITYERDINKSYMKIPATLEENIDEKIMLKRNIKGLVPVEKCFINNKGQYWYNITGKQALDVFCKVSTIGHEFFEELVIRICSQLETLEWNLLDTNCLVVDPELIFINSSGDEVSFVFYPQNGNVFFEEFQMLMEYLLTKIDHDDTTSVKAAYQIYEMSLVEGCNIFDLKKAIMDSRIEAIEEEPIKSIDRVNEVSSYAVERSEEKIERAEFFEKKLGELFEKAKMILKSKPEDFLKKKEKEEEIPVVIYPEEEFKREEKSVIHPTVCIASFTNEPKGMLLYEGVENYPDFELEKSTCSIGKSHKVKFQIDRETISQIHARIDYVQQNYYIEDMNSTNGTFVNQDMLNFKERRQLFSGDIIRFADVKYRFL